MAVGSSIEWTDATWNPVTGCTKISPGCRNCYAERMACRLRAMGHPRYARGFELTLQPDVLDLPARWRSPRMVFVNSMSDLFHEGVPSAYVEQCFEVMCGTPRHAYQILTKRADRLLRMSGGLPWYPNVWVGTSVENADYVWRVDLLARVKASVRFVSLEPLLGPIRNLPLDNIDWVIVGGESGPGARPVRPEWVTDVRDQCVRAGVPFFFKQWGGVHKSKAGRMLQGREWNQMPQTPRNTHATRSLGGAVCEVLAG
jgi:protein gp37